MELRLQIARSTRDVDLTLRGRASLVIEDPKERNHAVRELLEDDAATDLGDFFVYVIGEAMMDLNVPVHGGARFPVHKYLQTTTARITTTIPSAVASP